ncbi:GNAT family acetyltransferase [Candidatus Chloroploca sp. Khr17]|uniref:GNAT family acetyltransferase n=1 Tax=Candidatus Chloroploca sp. Khr17 TaxID=2496869 RepID=UPI00101DEE3E|nr:GNAT family acetyltransferase [Candidatus Chloroploca sp. Khr17]
MEIRAFRPEDEHDIVSLWERCELVRSWNDPRKDMLRKLQVQGDLFLVGLIDGHVVATVMAGYEGHRGWVNYVAVAPEHQRSGLARHLMCEAERRLRALGCPKVNLQVRNGNANAVAFYRALGYTPDDVISLGKRLENDA